jgi:hypothetical protein
MIITFNALKGGKKLKATALMPTDNENCEVVDIFPHHDIQNYVEASSYQRIVVYKVQDLRFTRDPKIAYSGNILPAKEEQIFQKIPVLINGQKKTAFVVNTAVPHFCYIYSKGKYKQLVFARCIDLEPNTEVNLPDSGFKILATMDSEETLKEFATALYNVQNEDYRHLGHLKLLIFRGKTGGLVPNLFNIYIRNNVSVEVQE